MAEVINPFMQSLGQVFASRNQHEFEKEMKINADVLKAKEKYRETVGEERFGDINDLWMLVQDIRLYINNQTNQQLPKEQAIVLLELLRKIEIYDDEKLHPYEVPALFHYKILISELEELIK